MTLEVQVVHYITYSVSFSASFNEYEKDSILIAYFKFLVIPRDHHTKEISIWRTV